MMNDDSEMICKQEIRVRAVARWQCRWISCRREQDIQTKKPTMQSNSVLKGGSVMKGGNVMHDPET